MLWKIWLGLALWVVAIVFIVSAAIVGEKQGKAYFVRWGIGMGLIVVVSYLLR